MFEESTRWLVREIDRNGSLIGSRLNDSEKLKSLAVVIKRSPSHFWQKIRYRPTDFTLNDLLQGEPIQIDKVLRESVFVTYDEKTESVVFGSGEIGMSGVSIEAKGNKAYKLKSFRGTLNKESLIIPEFLQEAKNRSLDLQHSLIQQTRGRSNQTFTVVKERIVTTSVSTIKKNRLGELGAVLTASHFSPAKACIKGNISLHSDTNGVFKLPPRTVMAYSVSELTIKSDGRFELCVHPDGIKTETITTIPELNDASEVDGLRKLYDIQKGSALSALMNELADTKTHMDVLAHMAPQNCFMLLNLFQKILSNRTVLPSLEDRLDRLCSGEALYTDLDDTVDGLPGKFVEILLSEKDNTDKLSTMPLKQNGHFAEMSYFNSSLNESMDQDALDSVYSSDNGSHVKSSQQNPSVLTAMHLLVSATDVLTDDGLDLLNILLSKDTICGLNYLVNHLTHLISQHVLLDDLPPKLRNFDIFTSVVELFRTSGVLLQTDDRKLWAEIESTDSTLPLVLCTVIHGLAYLRERCEVDIEI